MNVYPETAKRCRSGITDIAEVLPNKTSAFRGTGIRCIGSKVNWAGSVVRILQRTRMLPDRLDFAGEWQTVEAALVPESR